MEKEISELKIWKNIFFAILISIILEVVILIIAAKFFCEFFKPFFFISSTIISIIIVLLTFGMLKGAKATVSTKVFTAAGPFAGILIVYFVSLEFVGKVECDSKIDFTVVFKSCTDKKLIITQGDYTYFLLTGAANSNQAEINSKGYAYFNDIDKVHENELVYLKIYENMLKHYNQIDTAISLTNKSIYNLILYEKQPQPQPPPPSTKMINIRLVVPNKFAYAQIFVDNAQAQIVNNTLTVKTIRIEYNKTHTIKLIANDDTCKFEVFVKKENQKITGCN